MIKSTNSKIPKKTFKKSDIDCVFFVSKYRDAYLLDFINIIGLPNDFHYRLRYRKRWVNDYVKKGNKALIAFYNHDKDEITPIRIATIIRDKIDFEPYKIKRRHKNDSHLKAKIEESTFHYFVLSLGEFIGEIDAKQMNNIKDSSLKNGSKQNSERYFVYPLIKKASIIIEPGMLKVKDKDEYIKPWVKIINDLSYIDKIKNGCFLKIFLIEKADFSNIYLKNISKIPTNYYSLKGGSEYRLVLEQYCPKFENEDIKTDNPPKVTYEISSSEKKHLEVLKKEINLYRSGLYDFHEILFRTKNVLKTKNELLIISPKEKIGIDVPLPEFKLPIRIRINFNGILLISFLTLNALLAPVIIALTIVNAQKPEANILELTLIAIGVIIIGLSAILRALERWSNL